MSERWGACRRCTGKGCGMCGETGMSGDAIDYLDPIYRVYPERVLTPEQKISHEHLMKIVISKMKEKQNAAK